MFKTSLILLPSNISVVILTLFYIIKKWRVTFFFTYDSIHYKQFNLRTNRNYAYKNDSLIFSFKKHYITAAREVITYLIKRFNEQALINALRSGAHFVRQTE